MGASEFDLIARYFAPLAAAAPGAFALTNDAALVDVPDGRSLVTTVDSMVAGVHFRDEDRPTEIAAKLLAVNLSDLAAMGARPFGYLVAASFPQTVEEAWIAEFAAGLGSEQAIFGISLLGGDTTSTTGPLTLSLTAFGHVPSGKCLQRATARAGDDIYVSGWLGDAALGLDILSGRLQASSTEARAQLVRRYLRPTPRLALGAALLEMELASAALDVSDGLVADLGHMARQSGLAAGIEWAALPLSPAARAQLARDAALRQRVLGGGDDYELVFAAAPVGRADIAKLARRLDLPLTRIGSLSPGSGVSVRDEAGRRIAVTKAGWAHF